MVARDVCTLLRPLTRSGSSTQWDSSPTPPTCNLVATMHCTWCSAWGCCSVSPGVAHEAPTHECRHAVHSSSLRCARRVLGPVAASAQGMPGMLCPWPLRSPTPAAQHMPLWTSSRHAVCPRTCRCSTVHVDVALCNTGQVRPTCWTHLASLGPALWSEGLIQWHRAHCGVEHMMESRYLTTVSRLPRHVLTW